MSVPQLSQATEAELGITQAPSGLVLWGPATGADRIEVQLPEGWLAVPDEEPDLFVWALDEPAAEFRLRVRRHPAFGLDADLRNLTDTVAHLDSPLIVLHTTQRIVAWLGGAAGEVVIGEAGGAIIFTQRRGACSPAADPDGLGIALFPQPVLLRPAQAVGSTWMSSRVPAGVVPPEPAWLPLQRYVELGEPIELDFPDGAVVSPGLTATTDPVYARTALMGPPGPHVVTLVDARGASSFEVGWFRPLSDLVADALEVPDLPCDLEAWLRSYSLVDAELDRLDLALGRALESPTLWGLLAGLRVAAFTDLPVKDDLREAVRVLVTECRSEEAIPILAVHSLRLGQDLGLTDELCYSPAGALPEAWQLLTGPADVAQQLLADVEFGRISSEAPAFGGRQVALAELWLASQPDSVVHLELGQAVDRARRRLLAGMSQRPEARELAWLLVGDGLA